MRGVSSGTGCAIPATARVGGWRGSAVALGGRTVNPQRREGAVDCDVEGTGSGVEADTADAGHGGLIRGMLVEFRCVFWYQGIQRRFFLDSS